MRHASLALAVLFLAAVVAVRTDAGYSSGRSSSSGGGHSFSSSGSHSYSSGNRSSSGYSPRSYSSSSPSRSYGSGISDALRHEASKSAWGSSRPTPPQPAPSRPTTTYQTPAPWPSPGPSSPRPAPSPAPWPGRGGGGGTVVIPVPIPVPYRTHNYSAPSYSYGGGYSRPAPAYSGSSGGSGTPPAPGTVVTVPPGGGPAVPPPPRRSHAGMMLLCLLLVGGMAAVLIWTLWSARQAAAGQGPTPSVAAAAGLFNPLNLKVGYCFELKLSDYDGLEFRIEELKSYSVRLAGETHQFAAYCGVAEPLGKDPVRVQLRVEKPPQAHPEWGEELNALALHTVDEFGFTKDFYQVVTDDTGLFQITDDATGAVTAEYRRPTEVNASIPATVSSVKETPGAEPGTAGPAKVSQVEYWDYKRELEGGGAEFLIVELDKTDGWFRIFVGPEIDISRVKA